MQRPLQGTTLRRLPRELLAGATLLALSIPLNIGYAQIAGLPASAGLYALVVPTVIYAVLVSSRQVVASPDAAAAALVFSSLVGLGVGREDFAAMAAGQAIVCGVALLLASWFRLGFLANFLSRPILTGFVAGLALEVLVSQVRKMLGLGRGDTDGLFAELLDVITHLGTASLPSVLLSSSAVVLLVLGRRYAPKAPGALIVLVLATVVTGMWGLEQHGVAVLGAVPAGPPQLAIPLLNATQWASLVPSGLALALVTMAEGVLISRSYGELRKYPTKSDRDLLAFGAANIAAGVSMSFAMGPSTSRTAAMDQLGSRTQVPSIVLAAGSMVLLLFGTQVLAQIPTPVIGSVVAVAVVNLLGLAEFRELIRLSTYEFAIGISCLLGVLVLGPLQGLGLAFVLSLINLARRAASAHVHVLRSPYLTTATVGRRPALVVRFAGPVFFANSAAFVTRVMDVVDAERDEPQVLILDAEGISDVDVSAARDLHRLLDRLRDRGIEVALARARPALQERLHHFGLLDGVRVFSTNREAVIALSSTDTAGGVI